MTQSPKQLKIIITGAGGQLGQELQALHKQLPAASFFFFTRNELAIDNASAIAEKLEQLQPDYLINCAAYTAVDKAEDEAAIAFAINTTAVENLAIGCKNNNCRFIHISTDYVFDGNASIAYKETDATNPQTIYGSSKREGERKAITANGDCIILRSSWLYSAFGKNFVKTMLRLMQDGKEINVVNDQLGSPTYAANLAVAILRIIEVVDADGSKWQSGIYHFSDKGIISWYDFTIAIKNIIGSNCIINPILSNQYPTRAERPAFSALDTSAINAAFGIQTIDWKIGLEKCIERLRNC